MFDFQQKRKLRAWAESRLLWFVLGVLTIFVSVSGFNRYQIASDMADRRTAVENEVKTLEARRVDLKAQVDYLSNERGMEAEMRRQFDIAREGEQVVIILKDEESAVLATTSNTEEEEEPWYKFW